MKNKSVATYLRANVNGQRDLNPKILRLELKQFKLEGRGFESSGRQIFFALNVITDEIICFIFFS